MTDVFNIDLESEGFRRNQLDWRKFREKYNKLSASKLERGIKPLPITLLLKLFGPQKVLNTYVVTRRSTAELDIYTENPNEDQLAGMKGNRKDNSTTKTLNFPGEAVFIYQDDIEKVMRKSRTKSSKYDGLPSRPVFQRGLQVPGRFFPKPSALDEGLNPAVPCVDTTRERPWTYSHAPRATHVSSPNNINQHRPSRISGFKGKSAVLSKNAKVIRGSVCKSTDTASTFHPQRVVSGKSIATMNSASSLSFNDSNHLNRKPDVFANSFHNGNCDHHSISSRGTSNSDLPLNVFNIKGLRLSARQVSFPSKNSPDFSTILQGRPKTLHRREMTESAELQEPRAKTHVGFAVSEMT